MVSSKKKSKKLEKQKKQQKSILIAVGVLFAVLWGAYKTLNPRVPEITSLNDSWEIFESVGQEWQEEIYIESVTFQFSLQTLNALVYCS